MPNYYKRPWNEERADDHADWGTSIWFFEVDDGGFPTRKLEIYQSGVAIRYDTASTDDEFGGLSQAPLEPTEFQPFGITASEFEEAWKAYPSHNQSH